MNETINTRNLTGVLPVLMSELVHGSLDHGAQTYMLNRGDGGLLRSLDQLSAADASRGVDGGASIAGHVDHLRYNLMLLNRWAAGERNVWKDADWTASWQTRTVTDAEWRRLRDDLRREADARLEGLRTPRDVHPMELSWVIGSIAHLAYHFGAIRQIDRSTRGPTAEEDHVRTRA